MALAFSFVGSNVVRVTGSGPGSFPYPVVLKGVVVAGADTPPTSIRIKDLSKGHTVFFWHSHNGGEVNSDGRLPMPQFCKNGLLISTFVADEALIYKG